MKNFEKLWQEYVKREPKERVLSDEQHKALRKAFFTGAWCHMTFAEKIRGLRYALSKVLIQELERELAREVGAPFQRSRPAAPPPAEAQVAADSFPA